MKIATFVSLKYGHEYVGTQDSYHNSCEEYARTSEWLEVQLTPRAPAAVVVEQLAAIDKVEANIDAEYAKHKSAIAQKRAELAALTYQQPAPSGVTADSVTHNDIPF